MQHSHNFYSDLDQLMGLVLSLWQRENTVFTETYRGAITLSKMASNFTFLNSYVY